jgi:hypothetical protein
VPRAATACRLRLRTLALPPCNFLVLVNVSAWRWVAGVNITQQLPAAQEADGFKLAESHAIMRYLVATRDVEECWYVQPCVPVKVPSRCKIFCVEYGHSFVPDDCLAM